MLVILPAKIYPGVAPEWIELSKHSKLITEISKESSNNYVVKRTGHRKTVSNKLMLGKPCLVETIKGEKVRVSFQSLIFILKVVMV